jgi:hypothetical protein
LLGRRVYIETDMGVDDKDQDPDIAPLEVRGDREPGLA